MKTPLVAALALACLPLAACNEADTAKAQEALAKACAAKDAVYSTWSVFATAFGASAKTQASVTLAYNAATTVCTGPTSDPVSGLVTVGAAAAQIAVGVKEIKQKHPEAVVPTELLRVVALAGAH